MLVFYLFLSPFFIFFFYPWSPTQEASRGDLREGKEMKLLKLREFLWVYCAEV